MTKRVGSNTVGDRLQVTIVNFHPPLWVCLITAVVYLYMYMYKGISESW